MSAELRLRTAFGDTVPMRPLREGIVDTGRIALDLVEVEPFHRAFRNMVRELAYDLSELPIATLGQAQLDGLPIVALPIPASRRFHHGSILCRADSDLRGAEDLRGRRVAARSWPQTSGVWIRGILQHEYGIDLASDVTWIVQEGPHVASLSDPDYVVLEESDEGLLELLQTGKVDAVTGLHGVPAGTRTVIPDAVAAAASWYERSGIFPVNHVITLKRALVDTHPWLIGAVTEVFTRAAEVAAARGDLDSGRLGLLPGRNLYPIGLEANRASMQMLIDFSVEQGILPAGSGVDRMFAI